MNTIDYHEFIVALIDKNKKMITLITHSGSDRLLNIDIGDRLIINRSPLYFIKYHKLTNMLYKEMTLMKAVYPFIFHVTDC